MALCLTHMENIFCYFTLISCNKISWWNLVFILRDLGEINGGEEINFLIHFSLESLFLLLVIRRRNLWIPWRYNGPVFYSQWISDYWIFFNLIEPCLIFFFFFQVIDVSLLGGAKNNASQGTNVCTLWCCHIDVPDIFYVIYSF